MTPTHRLREGVKNVEVVSRDNDLVKFTLDGDEHLVSTVTFDAMFEDMPEAVGTITYTCSCPGVPPIEVPRDLIMKAAEDRTPLVNAANLLDPNYPRKYEAMVFAANQMVTEGLLTQNPFFANR